MRNSMTAVENIIEKLNEHKRKSAHNELGTNRTGDYRIGLTKAIEFCEEHLEMEKEQIIDAFVDSRILSIANNCSSGEQYYNETYKQQDK